MSGNRVMMVNPLMEEVTARIMDMAGKCSFDVLYLDMTTTQASVNRIVEGECDLLVFQFISGRSTDIDMLLELVKFGYLSGKKILLVVDSPMYVTKVENKLGARIAQLRNVKYVMVPIDDADFRKRYGQLSEGDALKSPQEIFEEIRGRIVSKKNARRSRLSRLVERFI